MLRPLLLLLVGLAVVGAGLLAALHASATSNTITASDADVNKDGAVTIADALAALARIGQRVPTPTPVPTPTAIPSPANYETYTITKLLDQPSQSPFRTEDVACNGHDEPVGYDAEHMELIVNSYPVRVPQFPDEVKAWRFNYDGGGSAGPPTVSLLCLRQSAGELPITHVVSSNGLGASPFYVSCPAGSAGIGWGALAANQFQSGSQFAGVTPETLQDKVTDWRFDGRIYNTMYAICLGTSSDYVPPASYVTQGSCDLGDAAGPVRFPGSIGTGANVCIDNPPLHAP